MGVGQPSSSTAGGQRPFAWQRVGYGARGNRSRSMHEQKIREALADPSLVDEQGPHRDAVLSTLSELNSGQREATSGDDWVAHDCLRRHQPVFESLRWLESKPENWLGSTRSSKRCRKPRASRTHYPLFATAHSWSPARPHALFGQHRPWVGTGSMIDTTTGSCAQVGRNGHVAGGVGIGGSEPPGARPVIIEDDCFWFDASLSKASTWARKP